MIDSPNLGGLVKGHTTTGLGNHSVKSAVAEVIHPRGGGAVTVDDDLMILIMKLITLVHIHNSTLLDLGNSKNAIIMNNPFNKIIFAA